MDKVEIVCSFTDFGMSWYGAKNKEFTEAVRDILVKCFDGKIRVDWDSPSLDNILYLSGKDFTIKVNPMTFPGHFYIGNDKENYKKLVLTNIVNYQATKDASLVRIPYGDPGMRLYGEYDDEGLFSDTEYMNQPVCLSLEIVNMALKMLGDYNEEAKDKLIKTFKNILVKIFGYKEMRVEQEVKKALEKKVVSGMILEELFDEFTELRSR